MVNRVLTKEEKEKILETLEEDREFRYALMGLLGFKELLEKFAKLEERQQKLEERFAELEERQQRLEERFARLEERFAKLEERFARVEEEVRDSRRVLSVIAHRFGVLSEAGFRETMKYVIEEILGAAKVEQWVYRDDKGFVYGYPSVVEVDIVVRDKEHVLVEVKSRVSKGDVAELYRIMKLYERVKGVKPKAVIIGGLIDPEAYEAAAKLNVEVKPVVREKKPP